MRFSKNKINIKVAIREFDYVYIYELRRNYRTSQVCCCRGSVMVAGMSRDYMYRKEFVRIYMYMWWLGKK